MRNFAALTDLLAAVGTDPREAGDAPRTVRANTTSTTNSTSGAPQAALPIQRRALAALLLSPALIAAQGIVQEATASTVDFQDKEDGFSLVVPKDWTFAVPQQPYDRFRCFVCSS